ncbi:MAG: hypothetical protein Q8830_01670 [Candidatus Phytoplasma australasiaticum]|nr:hypothetical protein [Candidatus Phytoplasma australasiaticum]MDV3180934.1 hypothetical protein [Candidatus Phytoplasma australasiaticum]MDV3183096.1 hypothetical protein [Candidatus Phytoplasma australasiaticum]MDV3186134.1 hypothetical protein [Candidatus Phytoplasma australasiaticum]MDV3192136.1 hypothetical protein [Candidatus Phytoplasma australasiaticum]
MIIKKLLHKLTKMILFFCDLPYDYDIKTFNSYSIEIFDKDHQKELCFIK